MTAEGSGVGVDVVDPALFAERSFCWACVCDVSVPGLHEEDCPKRLAAGSAEKCSPGVFAAHDCIRRNFALFARHSGIPRIPHTETR